MEWMSVLQVAIDLGVARQTVWRWIRSGRLPARVVGHTLIVHRSNVERMRAWREKSAQLKREPWGRRYPSERTRVMHARGREITEKGL